MFNNTEFIQKRNREENDNFIIENYTKIHIISVGNNINNFDIIKEEIQTLCDVKLNYEHGNIIINYNKPKELEIILNIISGLKNENIISDQINDTIINKSMIWKIIREQLENMITYS